MTSKRRSRSRGALLAAVVVILLGAAAPTYAATAAAPVANPHGKFLGVGGSQPNGSGTQSVRGARAVVARPRASASSQMTYHGGPVQHSSAVYAIFWTPPSYTFPSSYQPAISQYFTDVAHDSYLPSNVYGVTSQYYDITAGVKKYASYNVAFKGIIVDTRALPTSGCPKYVLGDSTTAKACLTDAQIEKEIKAVIASHKLPKGIGNQYFLFTPQGIASCTKSNTLSSGGCYNPLQFYGFCAYHSHIASGARAVLYANMPYSAVAGCQSGQSPNGNAATDSVLNNVSHEHNDTITDPLGTGWYDSKGAEIAEGKCHLAFGSSTGATATGQYNQVINGRGYWLQQLWSNRANACVQRNTFSQPSVAFSFSPTAPIHGKKVRFKSSVREAGETAFSYRWTFPGGGVSAAANPTHTFASAVFVGMVTLVVTDKQGDQARFVRTITVI